MEFDFHSNVYYLSAPDKFAAFLKIVNCNPRTYGYIFRHSHKEIGEWIDSALPQLQDNIYKINTKCYWILNGLTDFPVCPVCGKRSGFIGKNVKLWSGYHIYCGTSCANLDPTVNEKKQNTCIERFGVAHALQSKACMDKFKNTCLQHFGVDHNFKAPECIARRRKTWMENYGCENPNQSQAVKDMKIEKSIQRYGTMHVSQSHEVKAKITATNFEKYGYANPMQCPDVREKAAATMLERYGVVHPSQSPEIMKKARARYLYDGLNFDSAPEMAYYIWLRDSGADFEYKPNIALEYESDGVRHIYRPDFRVGPGLVEIKGGQFLNRDGTWRNPYRDPEWSDGRYAAECARYEAKRRCCVDNGVEIMYPDGYAPYIEYAEEKYGRGLFSDARCGK